MDTVKILIACSREEQAEIEEICITRGIDFSRYFMDLYRATKTQESTGEEYTQDSSDSPAETPNKRGRKKSCA